MATELDVDLRDLNVRVQDDKIRFEICGRISGMGGLPVDPVLVFDLDQAEAKRIRKMLRAGLLLLEAATPTTPASEE